MDKVPASAPIESAAAFGPEVVYEPPRLVRLGTLAQLTLGGDSGIDDIDGASGDQGSV